MSESKERDEIHSVSILIAILSCTILFLHWYNTLFGTLFSSKNLNKFNLKLYKKIGENGIYFFRLLYIVFIAGYYYIKNPAKRIKEENIFTIRLLYVFFTILLFIGTINFLFYDAVIYPILIINQIYITILFFATFRKKLENENIFGVSNIPTNKIHYKFETVNDETLAIHSATQHIGVIGGTGAGKSDTFLKPTIRQHVEYQLPALIYDAKPELPLTKTVHTCYVKYLEKDEKNKIEVPLKIFNISNHKQSFRINMLDKDYINKDTRPRTTEIMKSFLTNLNEDWRGMRGKKDHWFNSALTVWVALTTRFLVDDKIRSKLNFPILWELIMNDRVGSTFEFIKEKKESYQILSPLLLSKSGNMKQFTSEFSSAMAGLSTMVGDKYLYWLLSANQINLDINSEENKAVFCIGGNNGTPQTHTPIIASIISLVMSFFREPDKLPTLFQLDELYTIYLEDLAKDSNLFRSNNIIMQIGIQLKSMLDDMYGKEKANNIFGACGNQAFGMGNDNDTSMFLEKMLSEVKEVKIGYSDSDSGSTVSQNLVNKKAMNIREINAQETGRFTGKIANGKPPYFSEKFKRYKYHDQEIDLPNFSLDAYESEETFEKEIEENYQSIYKFAQEILDAYPEPEPEQQQ